MPKKIILTSSFAILVDILFAAGISAQASVKVNAVAKGSTLRGMEIYKIDYSYEFKGRETVYIGNLGPVLPEGRFVHLAHDPIIKFLDFPGGRTIATSYSPTTYQPLGQIEMPSEAEFSQAGREDLWEYHGPFQEITMKVLNKRKFLSFPYQRDQLFFVHTTYTWIENLPKGLNAQIALRVSHPHRPKDGKFWFRVQFSARERRSREEKYRPTLGEDTQKGCNEFIDAFVKELTDMGRRGGK